MLSPKARAASRLPFQAMRMRSKAIFGPLSLGDQTEMPARSEQTALDQPLGIHRAVGTQSRKTVGGARLAGGNPGDIVSQHIETANLDAALKVLQPPRQQHLGQIAGLARMVN